MPTAQRCPHVVASFQPTSLSFSHLVTTMSVNSHSRVGLKIKHCSDIALLRRQKVFFTHFFDSFFFFYHKIIGQKIIRIPLKLRQPVTFPNNLHFPNSF